MANVTLSQTPIAPQPNANLVKESEIKQAQVDSNGRKRPNPHADLANDRIDAEAFALVRCFQYGSAVISVDGSLARVASRGNNVHQTYTMTDTLSTCRYHDAILYAKGHPGSSYCKCGLHCACRKFDTALFTHTIFRFTPSQLFDFIHSMSSKTFFAVCHYFDQPFGHIGSSGYYYYANDKLYTMPDGADAPFVDLNPSWFFKGYYHNGGDQKLVWTRVASFKDTYVYKFYTVDNSVHVEDNTKPLFDRALASNNYVGPVRWYTGVTFAKAPELVMHSMSQLLVNIVSVESLGSTFCCVTRGSKMVYVSKAIIAEVGTMLLGSKRDSSSYQFATRLVQKHLQASRVPNHIIGPGSAYTVALAFLYTVDDEISALHTLIAPNQNKFQVLNDALDFNMRPVYSPFWFYWQRIQQFLRNPLLHTILFGGYGGWKAPEVVATLQGKGILAALRLALRFGIKSFVIGVLYHFLTMVDHFRLYRRYVEAPLARMSSISLPAFIYLYNKCKNVYFGSKGRVNIPLRESTTTAIAETDKRIVSVGEAAVVVRQEKDAIYHVGLSVGDYIPIVSASNNQNELVAVANRQLACKDENDKQYRKSFAGLATWISRYKAYLFPQADEVKVSFAAWNDRYPVAQRERHLEALRRVQTMGVNNLNFNIYAKKAFIKKETLFKAKLEGLDEYDPRLIQGCHDEYNVLVGPWIYAFTQRLKLDWHADNFIVYGSGLNAEQLGRIFTRSLNKRLMVDECDQSRFDAHIKRVWKEIHIMICGFYGCPPDVQRHLEAGEEFTFGKTPTGVKYRIEGTQASGSQTTTESNTIFNALLTTYIAWCEFHRLDTDLAMEITDFRMANDKLDEEPARIKYWPKVENDHFFRNVDNIYKAVFCGDDNLVFRIGQLNIRYDLLYKRFGLKPKSKVDVPIHAVEYCSGVFYPIRSVDLEYQYKWGPKIGKMLAKLAFSITPQRESPWDKATFYAANLKGILNDVSHIPVLGEFSRAVVAYYDPKFVHRTHGFLHRIHAAVADEADMAAAREWFYARYGIADYVWVTERLCALVPLLPYLTDDHNLSAIMARDVG